MCNISYTMCNISFTMRRRGYKMSDKQYVNFDTGEIYESAEQALRAKQLKDKDEERKRKKELENKNPPFIQLTKGVSPSALSRIANRSSTAIQVLMFFFENMDDYNVIMVSQNTIAESIEKTRKAVNTAIKVLEEEGAIGIGKVSNANVYIVNPAIAWQKGYKQRGIVKMKAVVLLGEDENKKLFERFEKVYEGKSLKKDRNETIATKIIKGNETPIEPSKNAQNDVLEPNDDDEDDFSITLGNY